MDKLKYLLKIPRTGVLLTLISSVLVSTYSVGVKLINTPIGEVTFSIYLILFIISTILVLVSKKEIFPKKDLIRLWGRSLVSVPLVLSSFKALRLLPISDEALLAYTSIIFTIILGRIFLSEPCTLGKTFSSIGILTGVFLVTSGPVLNKSSYLNGCILSIFGALCDAATYIIIKEITHLHYSVILFNCSISSLILTSPFYFFENWTFTVEELLNILIISVLACLQELVITLALTTEQAGLVCLVHASDIIFSYVWELSLFNETYTITRISGAILVVISVMIAAYLPASNLNKNNKLPIVVHQKEFDEEKAVLLP